VRFLLGKITQKVTSDSEHSIMNQKSDVPMKARSKLAKQFIL
jgi:hypothetical protein